MCSVPSLITRGLLLRRDDDGTDPEPSEIRLRPLFRHRHGRAHDLSPLLASPDPSKPGRHARLRSRSHDPRDDQRRDECHASDHGVEQLERVRVQRPGRISRPADRGCDGEQRPARGWLQHAHPGRLLVRGVTRQQRQPHERPGEIPERNEGDRGLHPLPRPSIRDLRLDRHVDVHWTHGRQPGPRDERRRDVRVVGCGLHQGGSLQRERPRHEGPLCPLAGRDRRLGPPDPAECERQQPLGRAVGLGTHHGPPVAHVR